MDIFGISFAALTGQVLIGLVNGAFYATLSLGLAIIFGLLNIVNFSHGAMFMLGAFTAWFLLNALGIGFWPALVLAPLLVAAFAVVIERTMLRQLYKLDHLYGLLLTFGITLVLEGGFRYAYGVTGQRYPTPEQLRGVADLGVMIMPIYRVFVVFAALITCAAVFLLIERTQLGARLRAATENAPLTAAFGINVPVLVTATYALGVGLAALAGVLAAPIMQVAPLMGSNIIIIVFAVVVIGGLGSIGGAIITGLSLGVIEGLTKVFYPPFSETVVFLVMAIVLLIRPAGLFGKE